MKNINIKSGWLILIYFLISFSACKDVWDDHNKLDRSDLSKNLLDEVEQDTTLRLFAKYLKASGLDSVLVRNSALTVWAPVNSAFAQISVDLNDTAALRAFVKNHISFQSIFTTTTKTKIKLLSGKNVEFDGTIPSIGAASFVTKNLACQNGVLHTISGIINSPLNSWEYILSQSGIGISKEQGFLNSLTHNVFDSLISKITGTNANGEIVYDSVWVSQNDLLYRIADISNEDSLYTVFILNNTAYDKEYNRMKPFLADTSSIDGESHTAKNTRWSICSDLIVRGRYLPGHLPDTLISITGIKIPGNVISVESSYLSSNGIVYIVNDLSIPLKNKIPVITIEGENYTSTYNDLFIKVSVPLLGIRARSWASGQRDLFIPGSSTGHRIANLSVSYISPYLYTSQYKVVWRAVNDFQSGSFTQKLAINAISINDIKSETYLETDLVVDTVLKYRTIPYYDFAEHDLGRITTRQYTKLKFYVVANATITNNPIVLDYIKLIPILPE